MKNLKPQTRNLKPDGHRLAHAAFCFLLFAFCFSAFGQGTAFTYQGRLNDSGTLASGTYDLRFTLYDALANGSPVGGLVDAEDVGVSNGLFTVTLDFGGTPFDGSPRWLEIAVRPGASVGSFTNLAPRQRLTATPYAVRAANFSGPVNAAQLTGLIAPANIGAGTLTGTMLANGTVDSAQLATGSVTTSVLADGAVTSAKIGGVLAPAQIPNLDAAKITTGTLPIARLPANVGLLDAEQYISGQKIFADQTLVLRNINGSSFVVLRATNIFARLVTFPDAAGTVITSGNLTDISAVGTISAGTWRGSVIGPAYGGLGLNLAGAPAGSLLYSSSLGAWSILTPNGVDGQVLKWTNGAPAWGEDRTLVGGTVTTIATGYGLTGGIITTSGTISVDGTVIPQLGAANRFTGSNVFAGVVQLSNANNLITGAHTGDGSGLTALNAAQLTTGSVPSGALNNAWKLGGNAGTTPGTHFLGTTDDQPLELRVNHQPSLRLQYAYDATWLSPAPNVIGGSPDNHVSGGVRGGFIGGGGNKFNQNRVEQDYAAVVGGLANVASGYGSLAGGFVSRASGPYSIAMGSGGSLATGSSAVALGRAAKATNDYAVALGYEPVSGGLGSVALGNQTSATDDGAVALGYGTTASGFAAVALGGGTVASGDWATALGSASTASGARSTAFGFLTSASGDYSTAMGSRSAALGFGATAMGRETVADGDYSLAAGSFARAVHSGSFVWADAVETPFSSSGMNQFLIRAHGGVGIGTGNPRGSLHVYGQSSPTVVRVQSAGTPGFGRVEFVSDPQGSPSEWRPGYIQSTDDGGFTGGLAFVVNGTGADNRFAEVEVMRVVNGRVGIGNAAPTTLLQVGSATCNGSTWNNASDRNAKENFNPVNAQAVLEKVVALPLSEWNYKSQAAARHIGPVAQDFHAAFQFNGDDDKHISTVDADGVALAAIQGLNQKLENGMQKAETRVAKLEAENAELQQTVNELKELVQFMNQKFNGGAR